MIRHDTTDTTDTTTTTTTTSFGLAAAAWDG
jgi:hypothetical protein